MDIEQQLPTELNQNRLSLQAILKQTQKHQVNMRRVITLSKKVQDKNILYEELTCIAQKATDVGQKVNIFTVLVEMLAQNKEQNKKLTDYYDWLIRSFFNLRRQLDSLYIETEQKLKYLSNLLKLIDQIVEQSKKVQEASMQQATLVNRLYTLIIHLQSQKQFQSLQNSLCSLHVLAKLQFNDKTLQCTQMNLLKVYMQSIFRNGYYDHQIQEVILNTAVQCINKFSCLQEDYVIFVGKATFYMQLLSLLRFRLEMELICNRFECNFEEEFELITLIVEKYYHNHQSEIKKQLCWFWIKNYCNLFMNSGYIELSTYIRHLSIEVLDYLLKMLTQQLNQCQNPKERVLLLIIWKGVLVDDRAKGKLVSNRVVFQSVQLVLYQFVRQILNQLPSTLQKDQIYLVLSVYAQYYHCILRQKQCDQLRNKIVSYYINNYLQLVSPTMLMPSKYVSSYQNDNLIDLSHYDASLIHSILSNINRSDDSIVNVLSKINKSVGAIVLKHLGQIDSPQLKTIFMKGALVDYLIENNIELHDEKIDYALHQKLSNNLQKYMRIIRQSKIKNRYEDRINAYIVDLLGNEIDQVGNVKLLPSNFCVFVYLIQKLEHLLQINLNKGQTTIRFISFLYAFAQRSLYLHVPDAIYLLLLAIAELKERIFNNRTVIQQEMTLITNLIKFCNHYSNHTSYALVGYAAILLLIYGTSSSALPADYNPSVSQFLETQEYFLERLSLFLEKQILKGSKTYGFQRKKSQIHLQVYRSFWQVFRKNLLVGLMKNLHFAAHNSIQRHRIHILNQRGLIHRLLSSDIQQDKPKHVSTEIEQTQNGKRMRYLSLSEDESSLEEQNQYNKKNYRRLVTHQKVEKNRNVRINPTFLDQIIEKGIQFNQFKEIRQIESCLSQDCQEESRSSSNQLLSNNSTFCRVNGKIRQIVHVKK